MVERHPFHQDQLLHLKCLLSCRQNVCLPRLRRFHTCPAQSLVNRCKSSYPPSSGHTSSILFFRVHQNVSSWPSWEPAANWKSKLLAHPYAFLKYQPASRFVLIETHRSLKF